MLIVSKDGESEDPLFQDIRTPELVPLDKGQDIEAIQEQFKKQGVGVDVTEYPNG